MPDKILLSLRHTRCTPHTRWLRARHKRVTYKNGTKFYSRISANPPFRDWNTEEDCRKVIRGGGEKNSSTSSHLQHHSSHKFYHSPRLSGPRQADRVRSWNSGYRLQRKSCFRICLSILQKVDHNRGVSATTMLIKVKHLPCIFFSSASPTKIIHGELKLGVSKFVY